MNSIKTNPDIFVGDINYIPADEKHKRKRAFGEIPLDIGPVTAMYLKLKRPENPQQKDAYKVIAAISEETKAQLILELVPKMVELGKLMGHKVTAAEVKKALNVRFSELTDEGYEEYFKLDAVQHILLPFKDKDGNPVTKTVPVIGPDDQPYTNLYLERGTEALVKISVQPSLNPETNTLKWPFRLVAVKLTKPIDWVPPEDHDGDSDGPAESKEDTRLDFSKFNSEY